MRVFHLFSPSILEVFPLLLETSKFASIFLVYLVGPNIPFSFVHWIGIPWLLWDRKMGRIFVRMLVDVARGKKFQDVFCSKEILGCWWFQTFFGMFNPILGEDEPQFWGACFSDGWEEPPTSCCSKEIWVGETVPALKLFHVGNEKRWLTFLGASCSTWKVVCCLRQILLIWWFGGWIKGMAESLFSPSFKLSAEKT